jgi:hypothetical protein
MMTKRLQAMFQTTEEKKRAGYRFSRLAFWACTLAFYIVLLFLRGQAADTIREVVTLYIVYAVSVCTTLGIFAVKDVLNFRAAMLGGKTQSSNEGSET